MVAFLGIRATVEKALIGEDNFFAELGACRDVEFLFLAINSCDGFFATQYSIKSRNFEFGFDVVAFPDELAMFPDADFNEQVAVKVSLFAQLYSIPITNTLGNDHLLFHSFILGPASPAAWTKLLYLSPLSPARVTSCLHHERPLTHCLSPSPITRVTFLRRCPWLALVPFTRFAFYCPRILHRFCGTENTFIKIDCHVHHTRLVHSLGVLAPTTSSEHFIQNILKSEPPSPVSTHSSLEPSKLVENIFLIETTCAERRLLCRSSLIVHLSFLGIRQKFIGAKLRLRLLIDLGEFLLGIRARVLVRMQLLGQFVVSFFNLFGICVFTHS